METLLAILFAPSFAGIVIAIVAFTRSEMSQNSNV